VVGYGLSGDAYNSTAPCEDGDGALRSMRMALQDAGVQPSEVRVCCLVAVVVMLVVAFAGDRLC
jgi:3-oxoacyl-(acyl-carrier-protein) synthase